MKIIKKLISLLFIALIITVIIIIYSGKKLYKTVIKETPIEEKIKEIKSKDNYIKIQNICTTFKNAIIAVEDHRFYYHKGIDPVSTIQAFFVNIKNKQIITGGSSISQQLAKNMYFSQEKKIERKIAEMYVVSQLEKNLTKDDILELYLNTIYYGNGYYGIGDAAQGYFNKKPSELTDNEATILAGLPNAPSAYSLNTHKDLAKKRQKQVLNAMIKYKYITQEKMDEILKEDN